MKKFLLIVFCFSLFSCMKQPIKIEASSLEELDSFLTEIREELPKDKSLEIQNVMVLMGSEASVLFADDPAKIESHILNQVKGLSLEEFLALKAPLEDRIKSLSDSLQKETPLP